MGLNVGVSNDKIGFYVDIFYHGREDIYDEMHAILRWAINHHISESPHLTYFEKGDNHATKRTE